MLLKFNFRAGLSAHAAARDRGGNLFFRSWTSSGDPTLVKDRSLNLCTLSSLSIIASYVSTSVASDYTTSRTLQICNRLIREARETICVR